MTNPRVPTTRATETLRRAGNYASQLHPVAWSAIAVCATAVVLVVLDSDALNRLVFGGIALVAYFLPTIFAALKSHPQSTPIILINVFLGWTVIGWFAALVILLLNQPAQTPPAPTTTRPQPVQELAARLARLDELAAAGIISEEERQQQRAALIQQV